MVDDLILKNLHFVRLLPNESEHITLIACRLIVVKRQALGSG